MAIYHLSAKPISRAQGRSATGAAAYRAGVEITDERTGLVHDYTRKGGVVHSELILPGGRTADRAEFWNGIEAHHKRGDAVLVREVEISLPTELAPEQRRALAVGYARELADRYGVAADVALHAPRTVTDRELEKNPDQYHETDPETGRRHNGNWHAHIMLSACHVQPDGTLGKKAVELDPIHCQRAKIENMADRERARWGELANAALERHGHEARIDHRSHAERGIEAEPSQHLGPAATGYERRTGEPSRKRMDFEAEVADQLARQMKARDRAGSRAAIHRDFTAALLAKLKAEANAMAQNFRAHSADSSPPKPESHLESTKRQPIRPIGSTRIDERLNPVQMEGETLDKAGWRLRTAFYEAERDADRQEKAARERKTGAAHAAKLAELQRKRPWFGRDQWAREVDEASWRVKLCERRAKEALEGIGETFGDHSRWARAADSRLTREYPDLREAMDEAAAQKKAELRAKAEESQAAQKTRTGPRLQR